MDASLARCPLLPHRLRPAGLLLLCVGAAMGLARFWLGWQPAFLKAKAFALISIYFEKKTFAVINNNYTNELIALLLLAGLVVVAFTKEKVEMPRYAPLRLRALVVALYINCALLAASLFLVFGLAFVGVLVANLYSLLVLYVVIFRWYMWRSLGA